MGLVGHGGSAARLGAWSSGLAPPPPLLAGPAPMHSAVAAIQVLLMPVVMTNLQNLLPVHSAFYNL